MKKSHLFVFIILRCSNHPRSWLTNTIGKKLTVLYATRDDKGLGDLIKRLIKEFLGITQECEKCEKKRQTLNMIYPFI